MEATVQKVLAAATERALPFLLIGGNAVILFGFARNTIDLDLLVPTERRSAWLDLMRAIDYRLFHGTAAFAQFEPNAAGLAAVDLMFVDPHTWSVLSAAPERRDLLGFPVSLPRPEHLIALKVHAASSPTRSKPESDWEDIRQLLRTTGIDPVEPTFRDLVRKFGGDAALAKLDSLA